MIRVKKERLFRDKMRRSTTFIGVRDGVGFEEETQVVQIPVRTAKARFEIEIHLYDLIAVAAFALGCASRKSSPKRKG